MTFRVPAAAVVLLTLASPVTAQTDAVAEGVVAVSAPEVAVSAPEAEVDHSSPPPQTTSTRSDSFFQSLGRDYRTFFTSTDTARTLVVFGTGALTVSRWDTEATRSAHSTWSDDVFGPGRIAGGFMEQMAFAGGIYAVGRMSGHSKVERVGSSLLRAQILSQSVVQVAKFATDRTRPDGSNQQSFPSGHTASAFATATVLQRELGWKIGVPAYAFAAWVGASRMEANKHFMSDVLLGAGVGIASARAVTVRVGGQRFAMGVAPASGGAAVTFTRH